jgi:hypothetical protein
VGVEKCNGELSRPMYLVESLGCVRESSVVSCSERGSMGARGIGIESRADGFGHSAQTGDDVAVALALHLYSQGRLGIRGINDPVIGLFHCGQS